MNIQSNPMLFISLVTIYCTVVNSYALDKTASDTLLEQHNAGISNVDVPMDKRGMALSLNSDMRMLARMLYASQRRRRVDQYANIRQRMSDLGKRSWGGPLSEEDPVRNDQEISLLKQQQTQIRPIVSKYRLEPAHELQNVDPRSSLVNENDDELHKRSQRLSINGALSSLADMLAASGRRRLEEELAVNKERLLKLGR